MIILLDIDGVLVTTPPWKKVNLLDDGFMEFNHISTQLLLKLYEKTNAEIVLTTSHRINYSVDQWEKIFRYRGLPFKTISKINEVVDVQKIGRRSCEINEWVTKYGFDKNYVIIDDDLSINSLSLSITSRTVHTSLMVGFDEAAYDKAFKILNYEIMESSPTKI